MNTKHEVTVNGIAFTVIEQGRAVYAFDPEGEHASPHELAVMQVFPERGRPSRGEWNSWSVDENGRVEFAPSNREGVAMGARFSW